jgi:chromosomal replication initiator protein
MPGRISLDLIDAVVSAKLGLTRVRGNAQPAVFNRQVAMYLAKYVGGWSTTAIGRFYNGRDHSTVCYSIRRVETKRERSPEFAQLIEELASAIQSQISSWPATATFQIAEGRKHRTAADGRF